MTRSRANRRFLRTMVLGILCLATLVWAAIDQFGIRPEVVGELAIGSAVGVLAIILAAALFVLLLQGLRRLLRGRRDAP